jgi:hypothetical protein
MTILRNKKRHGHTFNRCAALAIHPLRRDCRYLQRIILKSREDKVSKARYKDLIVEFLVCSMLGR